MGIKYTSPPLHIDPTYKTDVVEFERQSHGWYIIRSQDDEHIASIPIQNEREFLEAFINAINEYEGTNLKLVKSWL